MKRLPPATRMKRGTAFDRRHEARCAECGRWIRTDANAAQERDSWIHPGRVTCEKCHEARETALLIGPEVGHG